MRMVSDETTRRRRIAEPSRSSANRVAFGLSAWLVGAAAATALMAAPVAAVADEAPAVDAKAKKEAGKLFREGERAFKKHDYEKAANAFETANALAPHPAALYNAAKSWQLAGELVRSANLCSRYLRDAPENEKRRPKALKLIADLTPKLGRIEIQAGDGEELKIDGATPELDVTFVSAGDHLVTAEFDGEIVERKVELVAGSLVTVKLEQPLPEPPDEEEPDDEDKKPVAPPPAPPEGWSPGIFWTGAGLTAALGAVSIWSGLDTNDARSAFDENPTREGLDDGRGKQKRTNILLATTALVGVGTGAVGIFLTDWSRKPESKEKGIALGVGPGAVQLRGRF